MGIYEYFSQHHDYLLFVLAGVCLLIELNLLGLSGPLLFVAIGCIITGLLVTFNVIGNFYMEIILVALFAVASAVVLWNPLKKIQNKERGPETSSDMVGKVLTVKTRVTKNDGRVYYSGTEWLARLDSKSNEPIEADDQVIVTAVDGTIFLVSPVS